MFHIGESSLFHTFLHRIERDQQVIRYIDHRLDWIGTITTLRSHKVITAFKGSKDGLVIFDVVDAITEVEDEVVVCVGIGAVLYLVTTYHSRRVLIVTYTASLEFQFYGATRREGSAIVKSVEATTTF